MNIHIQVLHHPDHVQETLENAGWTVEPESDDSLYATHPQVSNEGAARNRLNDLGLLTTSFLRLEFGLPSTRERMGRKG